MKSKLTARKAMLVLCGISAAICVFGVVLMFVMDRNQTDLTRRILFTVAMAFMEANYIVRLVSCRDTKKDIAISVILCTLVVVLTVLLWVLP